MKFTDRQTIRLGNRQYTEAGAYFITLCADERRRLFGEIVDGAMAPSTLGWVVDDEWRRIETMRPGVRIDSFTLMPDHFHGILVLENDFWQAPEPSPEGQPRRLPASVGSILAGFKAAVTSRARIVVEDPAFSIWQRNYYECVIRGAKGMERVRQYIRSNPANWRDDRARDLR